MKTNIGFWRGMHQRGYFFNHPHYKERAKMLCLDLDLIGQFTKLDPTWAVAVIGGGIGRETAVIAPHVRKVYPIDLEILKRDMDVYLSSQKILNYEMIPAERWRSWQGEPFDLVYSIVTFQHLTKDLVRDYLEGLAQKLAPAGKFICQFSECLNGEQDAEPKIYEPNVRWSRDEITDAVKRAGLTLFDLRTVDLAQYGIKKWLWHWAYFGNSAPVSAGTVIGGQK